MLGLNFPEQHGRCTTSDIEQRIRENLAWAEVIFDERPPMSRRSAWTLVLILAASAAVSLLFLFRLIHV